MMIKKNLGVLAGSLMMAAGSQAAIDISGGDVLVVFNKIGGGAYFELAGVTADAVAGGAGFSIDLTSALGSLGSIDSFAVLGFASAGADGASPVSGFSYNYAELTYVDVGGGLLFAGTSAPTTNVQLINKVNAVDVFLDNANLGFNGEGSLGDFDSFATVADLLTPGATSVLSINGYRDGAVPSTAVTVLGGTLALSPSSLTYSTGPEVPVPAAAWLFGSALLGLGVVRRKK